MNHPVLFFLGFLIFWSLIAWALDRFWARAEIHQIRRAKRKRTLIPYSTLQREKLDNSRVSRALTLGKFEDTH